MKQNAVWSGRTEKCIILPMNYLYCSLEREGVEGVEGVEKVEGMEEGEGVEGVEKVEGVEGEEGVEVGRRACRERV